MDYNKRKASKARKERAQNERAGGMAAGCKDDRVKNPKQHGSSGGGFGSRRVFNSSAYRVNKDTVTGHSFGWEAEESQTYPSTHGYGRFAWNEGRIERPPIGPDEGRYGRAPAPVKPKPAPKLHRDVLYANLGDTPSGEKPDFIPRMPVEAPDLSPARPEVREDQLVRAALTRKA